mmetsp:Transcript_1045/g.3191  ORF Transcript_1045/g.3191 Transcript_1045/m.3191 type:complete len:101 (+) Transcript_1045:1359-1661(+)
MSSVMLALRGKPHHLQTCRAIYSHRFYAAAEAAKDEKEPLTEEEKSAKARHTAAQALAQTNNPVVLKAVESVMKGIQDMFGMGKKSDAPAKDPSKKDSDK